MIYVVDLKYHKINVFDYEGKLLRTWGGYGDQMGQFDRPWGIVNLKNYIYVADTHNNRIQVFDYLGKFIHKIENILLPYGITVMNDIIYVSGNDGLHKIDICGKVERLTYWDPEKTSINVGIAVSSEYIFVTRFDNMIIKFDLKGNQIKEWGGYGGDTDYGKFNFPYDVIIHHHH